MTATRIIELELPRAPEDSGWHDLIATVELMNAITRETMGWPDLDLTPSQALSMVQDPYIVHRILLARLDDDLVGYAFLAKEREHSTAGVDIGVVLSHRGRPVRGRGIGTRLAQEIIAIAHAEGARIVQAEAGHTDLEQPPRLDASNGAGSVPAEAASTRFLRRLGFTLGQVERLSALWLPVAEDHLDALLSAARPADQYDLVDWIGPVPEDLVDGLARLRTLASTAVPAGDLVEEEQTWDAERVRARDRRHREAGNIQVSTAVRHRPTGELVGFTNLSYPAVADGRAIGQGYTMVVSDHRGHNLGLRIKINNLRLLAGQDHGAARILTGNADENDAMLSINRALGFRPVSISGRWERTIDSAPSS